MGIKPRAVAETINLTQATAIEVGQNTVDSAIAELITRDKIKLIADLSLYCDPTGDDNNDGKSPTSAFATLQRAIDEVYQYDLNGFLATIYLADGTYADSQPFRLNNVLGGVNRRENLSVGAHISIIGNIANPENVVFSQNFHFSSPTTWWSVSGLTVERTAGAAATVFGDGTIASISDFRYNRIGATGANKNLFEAQRGCLFFLSGKIYVKAKIRGFLYTQVSAQTICSGLEVVLEDPGVSSPYASAFIRCELESLVSGNTSFSTINPELWTGAKFLLGTYSRINFNTNNLDILPGNGYQIVDSLAGSTSYFGSQIAANIWHSDEVNALTTFNVNDDGKIHRYCILTANYTINLPTVKLDSTYTFDLINSESSTANILLYDSPGGNSIATIPPGKRIRGFNLYQALGDKSSRWIIDRFESLGTTVKNQSGITNVAGAGNVQTQIIFPQPFPTTPNVQVSLIWGYNASTNGSLTERGFVLDGDPSPTGFTVRGVGEVNSLDKISWLATLP